MSLEATHMTTAIGGMATTLTATPRHAAAQGFDRPLPRFGQDHAAKNKNCCAREGQQQNSKMHPSGGGHLALLQRPGRQIDSTKRM